MVKSGPVSAGFGSGLFYVTLWASLVAQWEESSCNAGDAGDMGSISGSGRPPGGGHGNLLQYPCLENPTDRRAYSP